MSLSRQKRSNEHSSRGNLTVKERNAGGRKGFREKDSYNQTMTSSHPKRERTHQIPNSNLEVKETKKVQMTSSEKTQWKLEMRTYYKSVRAKPREKGPRRQIKDKTQIWDMD